MKTQIYCNARIVEVTVKWFRLFNAMGLFHFIRTDETNHRQLVLIKQNEAKVSSGKVLVFALFIYFIYFFFLLIMVIMIVKYFQIKLLVIR